MNVGTSFFRFVTQSTRLTDGWTYGQLSPQSYGLAVLQHIKISTCAEILVLKVRCTKITGRILTD